MKWPWESSPPELAPEPEFMDELLRAAPRFDVQITLALIQAVFWFTFIKLFTAYVVKPYLEKHPKRDQFAKLSQATFKNGYGIDFTLEKAFEFGCLFFSILAQHGVGGLLCMPSALGLSLPAGWPTVATLAAYGALCEVGWEIQDGIERIYQLAFLPDGAELNPPALRVIILLHHAMGLGMVLPMNVYYPTNAYYHELVFLLQFAALVAMGAQQMGYLLDVKSASGLRTMKVYVTLTWVTLLWSRVLRYNYVCYSLLCEFYSSGNMALFWGGLSVTVAMSLINLLFFMDATGKLTKFLPMSYTQETEVEMELTAVTASLTGAPRAIFLSKAQKDWAKVKGVVRMGAFKGYADKLIEKNK